MDQTTKPAAVIFDFDDTLVRTGPMIVEIYRGIFADLEIPFTDRDLAPGIPLGEFVRFVAHRHGRVVSDRECESASRSYRQSYDARASEIEKLLEPNAIDLLSALRAAGIRTAVASSGFGVVETAHAIGLANYLDTVVDRDGVERGKPAPDLFLAAATRLNVDPAHCCGIENAPAGIQAIVAARMCPIAVGKSSDAEDLGKAGAFRIFQGFRVLTPFRIETTYRDWQMEQARERTRAATATRGPKKNGAPA
ncbi:MAG: HAD family phosphatase [bacterium]|nr:HAD family phosphatase [bacterium]